MERSAMWWTLAWDRATRLAQIARAAGSGATKAYVKAGGDTGLAWVPGVPLPQFARPQWGPWLDDFAAAGMGDPVPWFYPWPLDPDKDCVARALAVRDSPEIVLNPETEWRWQNSNANPWRSLAEANAAAGAWVADLRARLPHPVRIGFSSCPTWGDFPYEGFVAACDFAMPQHYFFARMFTSGEDEVAASVRREHIARAGQQYPTVAILTACREYDDAGVIQLARDALADDSETAGFSSWEAANGAYQADAMRAAYALLPADATKVPLAPADPGFPQALNAAGELVLNGVNFGGYADRVVAIEATVENDTRTDDGRPAFYSVKWENHQAGPFRRVG